MSVPLIEKKTDVASGLGGSRATSLRRGHISAGRPKRPSLFTSSGGFRTVLAMALTAVIWGLVVAVVSA